MSQNIVEICKSKFKHAPITTYDKGYYQETNSTDILCDECIGAWIYHQAKKLAFAINRFIIASAAAYPMSLQHENESIDFRSVVPMLDYMNPIIGTGFDVKTHFHIVHKDPHDVEAAPNMATRLFCDISVTMVSDRKNDDYTFNFTVRYNDPKIEPSQWIKYLTDRICGFLDVYIRGNYNSLTDEEKQMIGDAAADYAQYHSSTDNPVGDENCPICGQDINNIDYTRCACGGDCPMKQLMGQSMAVLGGVWSTPNLDDNGAVGQECCKCHKGLESPYYIWNNQAWCIECMYDYVTHAAINTHLTDECGLTPEGDWPENMKHNYQSDRDWMISCISKYFNALRDTGWKFEPPTLYTMD